jgi:hypothetical protein
MLMSGMLMWWLDDNKAALAFAARSHGHPCSKHCSGMPTRAM